MTTSASEIRNDAIAIVRKRFDMPVGLGTEGCEQHLKINPGCNNCFSYRGCRLVLGILNWAAETYAETYPEDDCKEALRNYIRIEEIIKGLYDGYIMGTTREG